MTYLCNRDTVNAVYNTLTELVVFMWKRYNLGRLLTTFVQKTNILFLTYLATSVDRQQRLSVFTHRE